MSGRAQHRRRQLPPSLLAGWKAQPISLRLLRGFLGGTFLYAGIQKLADPTFFQSGSPAYIGSQLQGFSRGSPIGPLLALLAKFPVVAGVGVALTEIAIGVATLLGIGMMVAAAGGFALSTMLWLSASWHVYPYFLGSDSIYAVAWLAFLLGVWEMSRRKNQAKNQGKSKARVSEEPFDLSRRELIRGGALSLLTIAVGGLAWASAGKAPAVKGFAAASTSPDPSTHTPKVRPTVRPSAAPTTSTTASDPTAPSPTATHTRTPKSAPAGTEIATLDRLNVGQAVGFSAPGVGACALVRTTDTQCDAYSRTCTHQGCEVGWNQNTGLLVCPCHGAEFDPAQGGKAVRGPAYQPLQRVQVVVDQSTGQVLLPQ